MLTKNKKYIANDKQQKQRKKKGRKQGGKEPVAKHEQKIMCTYIPAIMNEFDDEATSLVQTRPDQTGVTSS